MKLAGFRLNSVVTEPAKSPVAFVRGASPLKEKEGTLGITKANVMPRLNKRLDYGR